MAVWPAVVDGLLALLPTLPGWSGVYVTDGPPVTNRGAHVYAAVGHATDEDTAGSYERLRSTVYPLWEEAGTVRVEVVAMTGRVDLPGMRATLFGLVDALQAALDADQRIGGRLSADGTVETAVTVLPVQNASGTALRVLVDVNYTDRS